MGGFGISELSLGPGLIGLCPLPGGRGDLPGDIALLQAWGADMVVSLVQTTEMTALGVAALPAMIAQAGIVWRHFPIADFDVPPAQAGWVALSAEIRGVLGQGGRVVLHCRGGCGRTGMMALRLMVEAGEDAAAALLRLRAVRPCAVETDAQQAWASAPVCPDQVS